MTVISKRDRRFPFRRQHVSAHQQDSAWQCETCIAPPRTQTAAGAYLAECIGKIAKTGYGSTKWPTPEA